MFNYYILILTTILLLAVSTKTQLNRYNSFFSFIFLFLVIFLTYLRPLTFNDDYTYLDLLESFNEISTNELGKISLVFYLQNKLILFFVNDIGVALKLNFCLIWFLLLVAIFNERIKNKIFLIFLIICFFQVLFFIQLRNAFAVVFLLWGIIRFFKGKTYWFLFLLASLYHLSIIPFALLFYFLFSTNLFSFKRKIKNYKLFLYFIISLICSFFLYDFYYSFLVYTSVFQIYLSTYISSPELGNTSIIQILLLFVHFFILRMYTKDKVMSPLILKMEGLIYCGLLFSIVVFAFPLFQRLILPFYLFTMCVHFLYIKNDKLFKRNTLFLFLNFVLYAFYLSIAINRITYFDSWKII